MSCYRSSSSLVLGYGILFVSCAFVFVMAVKSAFFLTDTTGFEVGTFGLLFSSFCNCQKDLDNVFPRGRHSLVHDGIKKERKKWSIRKFSSEN